MGQSCGIHIHNASETQPNRTLPRTKTHSFRSLTIRDPHAKRVWAAAAPLSSAHSVPSCHVRTAAGTRHSAQAANGGSVFVAAPHRNRVRKGYRYRAFWVHTPIWRACVFDVAAAHFATSGPHAIHGEFLVGVRLSSSQSHFTGTSQHLLGGGMTVRYGY